MSLLFSCGNICDICSTCAGVKRCPFRREAPSPLEDLEDIKYLIMKKDRNATNASEGMERVASSSVDAIASERLIAQFVACPRLLGDYISEEAMSNRKKECLRSFEDL